jgi:predicted P-loop ATPase
MHSITLENVLAQAVALFKSGFQYWFDTQEIKRINKNNEQFRIMSVEEELLLAHFAPCNADEADYFFTTTELVHHFTQKVKITLTESAKQKMGKALRAHKFERLKRQGRYVYAMQEKEVCTANDVGSVFIEDNHLALAG